MIILNHLILKQAGTWNDTERPLTFFPETCEIPEQNINVLCKLITLPLRLPYLLGVRMRAPQNETSGSVRIKRGNQ